jgi:hypothetical protein
VSSASVSDLRKEYEERAKDLKLLQQKILSLQTEKDFERQKLHTQFQLDMSLKNAELRSKDAQIQLNDDDLAALRAFMNSGPQDHHIQSVTGLSSEQLSRILIMASERRLVQRQLEAGSQAEIEAASSKMRSTTEQLAQSDFDSASVRAVDDIVSRRLLAKEALASAKLAAVAEAAAAEEKARRIIARTAQAAIEDARNELQNARSSN